MPNRQMDPGRRNATDPRDEVAFRESRDERDARDTQWWREMGSFGSPNRSFGFEVRGGGQYEDRAKGLPREDWRAYDAHDTRAFYDEPRDRPAHPFLDRVRELFHVDRRDAAARAPKGYTRSDERIREEVLDHILHLAWHTDIDASDVDVKVERGEVTLSGSVTVRRWKHMIEDVADMVHGVTEVHNHLRLRRAEETR